MKKKDLKNLELNKKSISDFSSISKAGAEQSERRSNCDYCPGPEPGDTKPAGCYTDGGDSCGFICQVTDAWFSMLCSKDF